MARFVYNPRTGVMSGLQGIEIGTPAQSIEQYVTTYISNNSGEVYDSDLVIATVLKNLDIAALSSLGGGGGGASYDDTIVVSRLDSDSAVIQYLNTQLEAILSDLDSDRVVNLARHNQLVQDLDSDYALTNTKFAALRSDLDSDVSNINLNLNNNLAVINNLLDSESQKVQSLKTRVYGLVKNNDSDHNKRLNVLEANVDSDRAQFLTTLRAIRGDLPSPFNLYEYYSSAGAFGYNPFHDSDLVIQSAIKGFNVAAASYDSDRTVQTINKNLDIAALSNINTNAIDSEAVYNMGFEHEWFYDSDRVMTSVGKNFSNIINIINNNLGKVDSEFVFTMLDSEEVLNMFDEHGLAYQTALDSESAEIRLLRADVNSLVAGTYNDAPVLARLNDLESRVDSETARIQLLFGNADSDTINIAQLRRDADSDSIVIQSLREQANIDSAYITLIRNDLDSDDHAIQSLGTRLNTVEATNTIQNSKLNSLEARADSDEIIIQSLQTQIDALPLISFDSDQVVAIINENVTPYDDSAVIARLDSDSIIIQDLQTQINNIDVADLRSRLDSDSVVIQSIRTAVDSDYALFNTKIALFNGLNDSDLTTVANLRNDVDSDSIRIQDLQTQINNLVDDTGFDSDQIESMINEHVTPFDDSILVARLDSDSIKIQDLQTQINNLVDDTGFDSDQVVAIINENVTPYDDSAVVARLDSDTTAIQDISSRVTVLEAAVDDTGFDSDQIESMINEHVTPYDDSGIVARLDSDETIIQSLQTQIDVLVAGTYDDSAVIARLDSDELIVQSLQTQINFLTARLDSDTTVIQSLQTQLDGFDVADIRARLDSDSNAIQSIRTAVDSDYALFNSKIALFNGLTDSDLTTVSILRNDLDSESFEIRALRSDVDSDSIRIQTIAGQVAALEAGTYDDSALVARLDSDSAVLQELRTNLNDSEFIIERTPLRLNNASFATTSPNQVLDTYNANEHKTVKYIISANKGTDWQSSECLVNHDGTTAYITEYSIMDSGAGDLYIPDVDVSGGDVRLLVTPQTTNINVSIIRTQIN